MRRVVVSVSVAGVGLRISRSDATWHLVRSDPKDDESGGVALTSRSFAGEAGLQAADSLLDEALGILKRRCANLRQAAVSAAGRAQHATGTMRRGSQGLRLLATQATTAAERYLREGSGLIQTAMDVEQRLHDAGLETSDRSVPPWMNQVLDALQAERANAVGGKEQGDPSAVTT